MENIEVNKQAETQHGYWIPCDYSNEIYFCSVCDGGDSSNHKGLKEHCDKCGAIMDKPVNHKAQR